MSHKIRKTLYITIALVAAILFVAKFAGGQILKLYIKAGIGNCRKIPILCMAPELKISTLQENEAFATTLMPYSFPKMSIELPKGFFVAQQTIKKVYYKKYTQRSKGAAIYLLRQPPGFFIGLFPQIKKAGINDDYEFLRRTMNANIEKIAGPTDAFFVIMKGIFIPDLGNQNLVRMIEFSAEGKRGFINYNLDKKGNYFDCNVFDAQGDYFKVYIKDTNATLDLDKIITIIATLKSYPQ